LTTDATTELPAIIGLTTDATTEPPAVIGLTTDATTELPAMLQEPGLCSPFKLRLRTL
jgi:hypothetical protein